MWCSKLRELIDIHGKSWTNFSHIHLDRNLTASITPQQKKCKRIFGNKVNVIPSNVKAINLKLKHTKGFSSFCRGSVLVLYNLCQLYSTRNNQRQPKQPNPNNEKTFAKKRLLVLMLGERALLNSHFLQEAANSRNIQNNPRTDNTGRNCPIKTILTVCVPSWD